MVEDSTGARVAGARVELINTETGTENDSISNRYGIFALPGILPGAYVLQITKRGFATSQFTGITLGAGDSRQFLIHMKVGPVSETVTVNASSIEMNQEDAAVSTIVTGQFAASLPLNGNSLLGLIAATPGITPLSPQSASEGMVTQGNFSVNGQATDANYYTVDGIAANINAGFPIGLVQPATTGSLATLTALGTTQGLTPLNDLREFKVLSATYSAQYGRMPGGQFIFTSKSGTNTFHGSGFEYFRNGIFNANDSFNERFHLSKPPMHQNEFGGTFSGPLILPRLYNGHNRTFFFADYQGYRVLQPFAAQMQYVPSLALRRESAGLKSLLNAFPTPTGPEIADHKGNPSGLAPFVDTYSLPGDANSVSARIDQSFFSRLHLFFRYNETPSEDEFQQLSSLTHSIVNSRTFTLGLDTQFSNSLSNSFRAGYARGRTLRRTNLNSYGNAVPIDLDAALGNHDGLRQPYPSGAADSLVSTLEDAYIQIPRIGSTALLKDYSGDKLLQWNVRDQFTLQRQHQTFNFGFDVRKLISPMDSSGSVLDGSFYSRNALLTNMASNVTLKAFNNLSITLHQTSAYFQDNWHILPSLKLSFGVRWEMNAPPNPENAQMRVLRGSLSSPSSLTLTKVISGLWQADRRNFAPRVGFVWSPDRANKNRTVFRAGTGVFYSTADTVAINASNYGIGAEGFSEIKNTPLPITKDQFDLLGKGATTTTGTPPYTYAVTDLIPLHLQLPYTLQWSSSVEQALGSSQAFTASYVGIAGRRLLQEQSRNINAENPDFGYVSYYPNHLTSSYDALQLKYQRLLSHGVQALLAYTWSHAIDYGSTSPLYPLTRASSDQDIRNNFQAAFTWDIGHVAPRRGLSNILNRWNLDGRVSARSGFPITLYGNMHLKEFNGDRYYSGVDLIPGRPLYLYGPQYPGGRMLNGGPEATRPAFVFPSGNGAGNAPRNLARGFGAFQVNLAIHRSFPIHNRLHGEFRISAFNILNHPNFGYIDPHLTDLQFGQTTRMLDGTNNSISPIYQQGGPRTLQFSLKVGF